MTEIQYLSGERNSLADVDGFLVGNSHDETLKSGVTVVYNEEPFRAAFHVMGGAPGTRETELLAPDKIVKKVDALVLSGGSAFGLDAASGVVDRLKEINRGYPAGDILVPIVPGAILFDLKNGGKKNWKINPYKELGRSAFNNIKKNFNIGSFGAGCGATTADLKGGLGTSSLVFKEKFVVGALVAVNSVGSTCFPGTNILYSDYYVQEDLDNSLKKNINTMGPTKNLAHGSTTLGIICTNIDFDSSDLTRLATSSHAGIARAVQPSHTPFDGDIIFSASSGEFKVDNKDEDLMLACHLGAVCIAKAIGNAVKNAEKRDHDILKVWQDFDGKKLI